MASIQMRQVTSLVTELSLEKDGWGFDPNKNAYIVTQNFEDGSRVVNIYPLPIGERYIRIILEAEEAKQLDERAKNEPPS